MAETAVGVFEDASVAGAVADSLRAHGFPSSGIRVVSAPAGSESKSNGWGEFGTSFAKDQHGFGISESESRAYLNALHRGHVAVYATGTRQQATEAVTIMNEFAALEIDAFAATSATSKNGPVTGTGELGTVNPESRLPESKVTIGEHEHSYTTHSSRSKTEGARVFAW